MKYWTQIAELPSVADYSDYESGMSSNGGKYAFYEDILIYRRGNEYRMLTRYSTSAEFDYDELNGTFQRCNLVEVRNTEPMLKVYAENFEYSVDLEEISDLVDEEYIASLDGFTTTVIEKDDNGELVFTEKPHPLCVIKRMPGMGVFYDYTGGPTQHHGVHYALENEFNSWCDKNGIGFDEEVNLHPYIVKGDCQVFVREHNLKNVIIY